MFGPIASSSVHPSRPQGATQLSDSTVYEAQHTGKRPRNPMRTMPSVYADWPADSTDSLSTAASSSTPPLSRVSSPEEDHNLPATPPDASSLVFFPHTEIPVQHIHLHVGSFYYPPSSIPASSPYKRGNVFGVSSSSLTSISSALSRKFNFGSSRRFLNAKPGPHPQPCRRETGPAIAITPPDSPPLQVFRPSIQRLTSRHMISSHERHPFLGALSSNLKPFPLPTGFLSHLKSNVKHTLSSIEPKLQTISTAAKTTDRDRGLNFPYPLRPEEIQEGRLSIAWETRGQRRAREEKLSRKKVANEAEAKRVFQENVHRYRAPFMGF